MKKIKLITTLFLIITAGNIFAGGGTRNGTAGASQLLVPVGARGIALAGSSIINSNGVEAIYWNPANLARGEKSSSVMFSQMNYIADIGVSYGAVSTNLESFGAIGFSIKTFAIGEIPVTTVSSPDGTGQTFTPQYITIGLTYSKLLSDRISFGVTANYISEKIELVETTGLSFNVGISYQNLGNVEGLGFAVVLKNLGPQMKYDGSGLYVSASSLDLTRPTQLYKIDGQSFELPSTLELGLGYQLSINETNSLQLNGVFQNSNFYSDEYRLGAEYSYDNMFYVRGGYALLPDIDADDNIFGLTAGVGINYNLGGLGFKFDYAFRDTEFFEDNHVFTVQFDF